MRFAEISFPMPEQNLACDEALLDECEESGQEVLRLWEVARHFVVLGYSNSHRTDTRQSACRAMGIPILRRCSGGGTVLQGPGCLNFSLILQIPSVKALSTISGTNQWILQRHRQTLQKLIGRPIEISGITDLTLSGQKFSGNSQRRKHLTLLFHGTFLLSFNLELIEKLLPLPSRQPSYRRNRAHNSFLVNIPVSSHELRQALRRTWDASEALSSFPEKRMQSLLQERYSKADWHFRL